MWNVNPTFGGPIKQDKLWFFATYTYTVTDTLVGDSYLNTDPAAWDFVPDTTQQAIDDQYSKDVSGAHHVAGDAAEQDRHVSVLQQQLPLPLPDRAGERRDPGQLRCVGAPAHPEQGGSGDLVVADHEPRARRGRRVVHPRGSAVQPAAGIGGAADHRRRSRTSPTAPPRRRCAPTRRSTARAARSRT